MRYLNRHIWHPAGIQLSKVDIQTTTTKRKVVNIPQALRLLDTPTTTSSCNCTSCYRRDALNNKALAVHIQHLKLFVWEPLLIAGLRGFVGPLLWCCCSTSAGPSRHCAPLIHRAHKHFRQLVHPFCQLCSRFKPRSTLTHQWVAVTRGHMAVRDRHAMINQCACHLSCKAKL